MPEMLLVGCRAEPIGSYLKALGVLRLVAEQLHSDVTGRWVGDVFSIESGADRDDLIDFFLNSYCPTPVMAPWNGRTLTGLLKHDPTLDAIENASSPRLAALGRTIQKSREIATEAKARGYVKVAGKKKDRFGAEAGSKRAFISMCRNSLPDSAVAWIDSVAVLTGTDAVFPLLTGGSGGNLGSGDLSLAYLEALVGLIERPDAKNRSRLVACLFDEGRPRLRDGLIGQFDPGSAGGVNVGIGVANPWNLVLGIEGALVFNGGVARRMGFNQTGKATMPFTVYGSVAGFGSAAEGEDTKGEVWTPIWRRPATNPEIRQVLAEGRATWAGSQAKSALDFVRAAASLGVDRGIDQFVRNSVSARLGRSNLATPVGRVTVREREGVGVLARLDRWLQGLRGIEKPSVNVASRIRAVERAVFAAASSSEPSEWQRLITEVSWLQRTVGRSSVGRDKVKPLTGLRSSSWLPLVEDGSLEFRIARAFASLRDTKYGIPSLRLYTEPLRNKDKGLDWTQGSPTVDGLGARPIIDVLADWVARRSMDSQRSTDIDRPGGPSAVIGPAYRHRLPLADALFYFLGRYDHAAFERILTGLLCLDFEPGPRIRTNLGVAPRVPAFSVLAPFSMVDTISDPRLGDVNLRADSRWPAMLNHGQTAKVLEQALLRLRMARLGPAPLSPRVLAANINPRHLTTALILPLTDTGMMSLLDGICVAELEEA